MPAKSMRLFMRAGNGFCAEQSPLAGNEAPTERVLSDVVALPLACLSRACTGAVPAAAGAWAPKAALPPTCMWLISDSLVGPKEALEASPSFSVGRDRGRKECGSMDKSLMQTLILWPIK